MKLITAVQRIFWSVLSMLSVLVTIAGLQKSWPIKISYWFGERTVNNPIVSIEIRMWQVFAATGVASIFITLSAASLFYLLTGRYGKPEKPLGYRIISGHDKMMAQMYRNKNSVVQGARTDLVITGSRSRDIGYLKAIEEKVRSEPGVFYTRVLFEPIRRRELLEHLRRLIEIKSEIDPLDGTSRVQIASLSTSQDFPERFMCVSERKAVVIIPSLTSVGSYDTALLVEDPLIVKDLLKHAKSLYFTAVARDIVNVDELPFEEAVE